MNEREEIDTMSYVLVSILSFAVAIGAIIGIVKYGTWICSMFVVFGLWIGIASILEAVENHRKQKSLFNGAYEDER